MTIFKQIEQNPIEYIVLTLTFVFSLVLFSLFGSNHSTGQLIIIGVCLAYFIWSLYHHYRRGDLQFAVIMEYLVLILLVLVVTGFTLF